MRRLASQKFCTRLQNSRKLATQSPISLSEKLRLKRVAGDTNSNDTEVRNSQNKPKGKQSSLLLRKQ